MVASKKKPRSTRWYDGQTAFEELDPSEQVAHEIVSEFGHAGTGPGGLGRPHNLAVDPSGNMFVAEAAGPWIVDPSRGDSVQAGFRAQKFDLVSGGR